MNRHLNIILSLLLVLFITSSSFALTWPASSQRITSGYGLRIPSGGSEFHRGLDISTGGVSGQLYATASGDIDYIRSKDDGDSGGNRIRWGDAYGWSYYHLADSISGNWEFGTAYAKKTSDPDMPQFYVIPVKYFAVKTANGNISYSTAAKIKLQNGSIISALTTITEPNPLAYSGKTGLEKCKKCGIHLHLVKWKGWNRSDTESPLKYYYPAGAKSNMNAPSITNLSYDWNTMIIKAETDTGQERDLNEIDFYVNGDRVYKMTFDPENYRKSGGTSTGIKAKDTSVQKHTAFKKLNIDCGCGDHRSGETINITAVAIDAGGGMAGDSITEYKKPCPTTPPGCDHPDDNFSVSKPSSEMPVDGNAEGDIYGPGEPTLSEGESWAVALYSDSYFSQMGDLLQNYEHWFKFAPDVISGTDLKDTNLLVIPSGGLHAVWDSTFFKTGLESFVSAGGTVLVFSQQHGYEYSALPSPNGQPISGYGWTEDQSCQNKSSYIDTYHQILASLSQSTPSINVDGYFSTYPANSTILLKRTTTGQPSAILYPYGKGFVIATAFYSDFGRSAGQAGTEEAALVRDMITWAKAPKVLPEIRPGETVTLSLTAENKTGENASLIRILIYDPERKNILSDQTILWAIPADQSAEIPVSYTTSSASPLGIYRLDYELYDDRGSVVQRMTWKDSARFVVSNPPTSPAQERELTFSIQSDSEHYLLDSIANFTVTAFNNSDEDKWVTAYVSDNLVPVAAVEPLTVPANGSGIVEYSGIVSRSGRVRARFYDFKDNTFLGTAQKGYWVYGPSPDMDIRTDKTAYARGETVNLHVDIHDEQAISYSTTVRIWITDPSHVTLYNTELNIGLSPRSFFSQGLTFHLASDAPFGSYTVTAEAFDEWGKILKRYQSRFDVPRMNLSINSIVPSSFGANTSIAVNLKNTGIIPVPLAILSVHLTDPAGSDIWYVNNTLSNIQVGEDRTLDFSVPISNILFGLYKLRYTLLYEERIASGENIISNEPTVFISFDKPTYKIRETANLTVDVTNSGQFNYENAVLQASSTDVNYTESRNISLLQGQTLSLKFKVPVIETLAPGQHNVNVTLILPSGSSIVQRVMLTVPESVLAIDSTGPTILTPGDTVNLTVENTGGVDTTYTLEKIYIRDSKDKIIHQGNAIGGTILSGEKKTLAGIQLPFQILNGAYRLAVLVTDSKSGKTASLQKSFEVNGITALLQARTNKDIYLIGEAITGLSDITNGPFGIENGLLNVAVKGVSSTGTGQFGHFLPIKGWWPFNGPSDVTVGPDGSIYVVDNGNSRILQFDSDGNLIRKWGSYGIGDGQFSYARGIAVGPDGSIYVTDYQGYNNGKSVQKFDSNGNYIKKWGSEGVGNGQFKSPGGIAANSEGYLYVLDNNRVQKFDSDGNFVRTWGNYGTGDGQFYNPVGIDVDPDGFVYVSDCYNNRIQKFDGNGIFKRKWGSYGSGNGQLAHPQGIVIGPDGFVYVADGWNDSIQKFNKEGVFIKKWGYYGWGDGQFDFPKGITAHPEGFIYVTEFHNDRLHKYDSEGNFIRKWIMRGTGPGEFYEPRAAATSLDGFIYVADTRNNRVQKFDSNGAFLKAWGSQGTGDGQFSSPAGIAVGPDGFIYVSDANNHRVQKFDSDGNFITKWGNRGSGNGQFSSPQGISVDIDGFVYIADAGNDRIQKFDDSGNFMIKWGSSGNANGQFYNPVGVAVGPGGSVYITDSSLARIQKFDVHGNFVAKWGSYGGENGQFKSPWGVAAAPDGSVYVTDVGNDTIQNFDSNGTFIAKYGNYGSGDGQFDYPFGVAVAFDGTIYVVDTYNNHIQKMKHKVTKEESFFETTIPLSQAAATTQDYITSIGTLSGAGKRYLQTEVKNSLGQVIARSEYPFYVMDGNIMLTYASDKKYYRPGETVTVVGEVRHFGATAVQALSLELSLNGHILHISSFDLPANGSYPFTITTTTDSEGIYTLAGKVMQNSSALVEVTDLLEVSNPKVTATASAPEVVGSEHFNVIVEIKNEGKIDASIRLSAIDNQGNSIDNRQIIIPSGESELIHYDLQIDNDTFYTFTFVGDLNQTVQKRIAYGLGAAIAVNAQALYPEGRIGIPVIVTNTGQLDEFLTVTFNLQPSALLQTKTYFIPKGANIIDMLYFDLTEGSYQLAAVSNQPSVITGTNFSIRKAHKVELTLSIDARNDGLIPVTVNIANRGYNSTGCSLRYSVENIQNTVVWNGEAPVPPILPLDSRLMTFNIDSSSIQPGGYTLKVEFLSDSGQQLAIQTLPLSVQGAVIQITQLPPYQTFSPGQQATFTFRVKNAGNREGAYELNFKAYDLIDSTQKDWLKAGEEKSASFTFTLPTDLEEKDYFADYVLKAGDSPDSTASPVNPGTVPSKGQIRYHLSGINIGVDASLDKQSYRDGDTAHLTLVVTQQTAGSAGNFFARVNYAGHEAQQTFTLGQGQALPLQFDVPLTRITGEKLFYGIYYESGRSIHLNSLYVYKTDDTLAVMTDKQVYNPGETVTVTVSSITGATGAMTLTGPDSYTETFDFPGTVTKTFVLSGRMTAGTYKVNAELNTGQTQGSAPTTTITASHPFDVAGIQVKVKEATIDKPKYAPSDTIALTLKIESNTTMPATLKVWIVDPEKNYTQAGEQGINLSSFENLLVTHNSSLVTVFSGIHRLVYGIYSGDLLLVSGSVAFDVGEAVLSGLTTDKTDYSGSETVIARPTMFGTVSASLELQIDGVTVQTQSVFLNGFMTLNIPLTGIQSGNHVLKGILTSGGLNSIRETSFIFKKDIEPPVTTAPIGVPAYQNGDSMFTSGTTPVTLTATDTGDGASGVSYTEYRIDAETSWTRYSDSFNLAGYAEGTHTIYYRSVDNAGNIETEKTRIVIVDNTPPAGSITINDNATYSNTSSVTLSLSASDGAGSGVTKMCLSNTDSCNSWEDYTGTKLWTLPSGDGGKTIYVWYQDHLGNADTSPYSSSIILDATRPILTVSTLSDGSWTSNDLLNVAGQATDNTGIQQLTINSAAIAANPDGTFSLPVTLQDGPNTVAVDATDLAGNQTADSRTIYLDRLAPTITLLTPADNTKTNQSPIDVTGTVDESSSVTVRMNSSDPVAASMSGSAFSLPVIPFYGINTIEVTATDPATNTSTVKRTVTFDDLSPSLSVTEPAQDIKTNKADMIIKGETTDMTVVAVTITIEGNVYTPVLTEGRFEQPVTFTEQKIYQIYVTAVDEAGNETTVQRNIVYDTTAPIVTLDPVTSPTPLNSQTLTGTVEAWALVSVTCPTATVGEVTYPTATTWAVTLSHMQQGNNTITINATDEAGNTSRSISTTITVFTLLPAGSFVIGDGNAAIGSSVTFWDSQWWKNNTLIDGAAPSSFKGFANVMSSIPPNCGGTWTATSGNSTTPPSGVPAYMAVLVSSNITKSGSAISGNIKKIVIVKTNAGYQPAPGYPGTATVVGVLCQ